MGESKAANRKPTSEETDVVEAGVAPGESSDSDGSTTSGETDGQPPQDGSEIKYQGSPNIKYQGGGDIKYQG
jgi:hypothetical protein